MLKGMPRPAPDEDTAPFWAACAERRLVVPRCRDCRTPRWPPGPMCPACQSTNTDWIEASGAGAIYSWTVVTHPVDATLADQVPYVVALVDLPEGVRIITNIIGAAPEAMAAGLPVTLVFEDQDGLNIPNFRPS